MFCFKSKAASLKKKKSDDFRLKQKFHLYKVDQHMLATRFDAQFFNKQVVAHLIRKLNSGVKS